MIRSTNGAPYARMLGVGAYRPSRIVTNDEVGGRIDVTDEWIRIRSGIEQRRWAKPEESVTEMALHAAREALDRSQVSPGQIDLVIVATITHLKQTPAAATGIAYQLGATHAAAFDLSAACAGFCYGVGLASDAVRCGSARYVLVIGADRFTDIMDLDDPSCILFGDGAGAAVVGPSPEPAIGPIVWGSDGSRHDIIEQVRPWDLLCQDPDPSKRRPALRMDGLRVFRWATGGLVDTARQAMDLAGITMEELDAFIPHQANMRIVEALAKKLQLPPHVAIARDIVRQGNTSAASVPLAIAGLCESGEARTGDLALLMGFGAGLVYAAQVAVLP